MEKTKLSLLGRLAMEPPFRILVRGLLKKLNVSARTRARWELSKRPAYLLGVLTAAEQALRQKVAEISAIEFGVAGGEGLLTLQDEAKAVEDETGIGIRVYGFDAGPGGLPDFIGDYRDHPDAWRPGDFPMDIDLLRSRLTSRTALILGNVRDTVRTFFRDYQPPTVGFVSFDLDLYSSTRDALQLLRVPDRRMLWHVPLYFDNIESFFHHRFAGERLAIAEFNEQGNDVKIDKWRGVAKGRPFPERSFLKRVYVAHDLSAISRVALKRDAVLLPLKSRSA
jgi:hypothetical protein